MKKYFLPEKNRFPDTSDQNLVAYYKLWAGWTSPTTVFDYAQGGFLGTAAGTDIAPAYEGFSFNGTDDKIDVGTGPTTARATTIWLKVADVAGNEYPIDLNGTSYLQIASGVVTVNGFTAQKLYVNAVLGTSGVTTIAADTWSFIVVTGTIPQDASNFDIGAGSQAWFEGKIGEVRLYSSVLTPQEIKSIYELTRWRYRV